MCDLVEVCVSVCACNVNVCVGQCYDVVCQEKKIKNLLLDRDHETTRPCERESETNTN